MPPPPRHAQDAPYEASLQAIRRHEFVGLLEQPGSADLSNRVDYSALRWGQRRRRRRAFG